MHERDINTDFLLIVLKNLMAVRSDLKVVLMSATLNAELFRDYFKAEGCCLMNIPGRAFPVTTFFLEDALEHVKDSFKVTNEQDCILSSIYHLIDLLPLDKKSHSINLLTHTLLISLSSSPLRWRRTVNVCLDHVPREISRRGRH